MNDLYPLVSQIMITPAIFYGMTLENKYNDKESPQGRDLIPFVGLGTSLGRSFVKGKVFANPIISIAETALLMVYNVEIMNIGHQLYQFSKAISL